MAVTRSKNIEDLENSLKQFISESLMDIKSQLRDVQESQNYISQQYEDFCAKLSSCLERVELMEKKVSKIDDLERRLEELEQRSRNCNVEISGLPESTKENPILAASAVGAALGIEHAKGEIVTAHRVPSAKSPKPLIVTLQHRGAQEKWLAAFRNKKPLTAKQVCNSWTSHPVYVNEHLAPHNRRLFGETKARAKECGYKYVWTRNARVFVRKEQGQSIIHIRHIEDIKKLIKKKDDCLVLNK